MCVCGVCGFSEEFVVRECSTPRLEIGYFNNTLMIVIKKYDIVVSSGASSKKVKQGGVGIII